MQFAAPLTSQRHFPADAAVPSSCATAVIARIFVHLLTLLSGRPLRPPLLPTPRGYVRQSCAAGRESTTKALSSRGLLEENLREPSGSVRLRASTPRLIRLVIRAPQNESSVSATSHEVRLSKIEAWLESGGRSPKRVEGEAERVARVGVSLLPPRPSACLASFACDRLLTRRVFQVSGPNDPE